MPTPEQLRAEPRKRIEFTRDVRIRVDWTDEPIEPHVSAGQILALPASLADDLVREGAAFWINADGARINSDGATVERQHGYSFGPGV